MRKQDEERRDEARPAAQLGRGRGGLGAEHGHVDRGGGDGDGDGEQERGGVPLHADPPASHASEQVGDPCLAPGDPEHDEGRDKGSDAEHRCGGEVERKHRPRPPGERGGQDEERC